MMDCRGMLIRLSVLVYVLDELSIFCQFSHDGASFDHAILRLKVKPIILGIGKSFVFVFKKAVLCRISLPSKARRHLLSFSQEDCFYWYKQSIRDSSFWLELDLSATLDFFGSLMLCQEGCLFFCKARLFFVNEAVPNQDSVFGMKSTSVFFWSSKNIFCASCWWASRGG